MATWLLQLPSLMTAGAMLGLAGLLLWLNHRKTVNWAFALLLICRALTWLTRSGARLAEQSPATSPWWSTLPFFIIPLAPLALAFAAAYPPPGNPPVRRRWKPWHLFSLAAVLELLYLLEPTLFWDLQAAAANGVGPELTAPVGPLFAFNTLFVAAYALVAFLLAREHAKTPPGPGRRSVLLISVGFGLTAAFSSVSLLVFVREFVFRHGPFMDAALFLPLLTAIALLLGQAGVLARTYRGVEQSASRRAIRRALFALALPPLSVLLLALVPVDPIADAFAPIAIVGSIWQLALPLLTVYALVRHQLFGIDLTVRWSIKQGTIAGVFVAVFFVVSESAAAVLSDQLGTFLGIAAAGLLVILLSPLQQLAERISGAAVPDAKSSEEMTSEEQVELFRDQLRFAWADGKLDEKERRRIENLRERLGLPEAEAYRLEAELLETN